uniref:TIG_SUH domain-containing protein n=1 Tax=Rhabditophanes sp. KR3021 TaxID=114890 RepID=A0AC35U867_9BILA
MPSGWLLLGVTPLPRIKDIVKVGAGPSFRLEITEENFSPNLTFWFGDFRVEAMHKSNQLITATLTEKEFNHAREKDRCVYISRDDGMVFEFEDGQFDDDINYIINEHKNAKKELEESEKICQTEQLLIDENDNLMEEAMKMIDDDYTAEIKACYKAYMVKFEVEQAKKEVWEENEIKNHWNVSREIAVGERKRNINLENTVYANTDNGSFIYTEEILSKQHASSIASLSYPIPPSTTGSSIYTEDLQPIKPREEIIFSCSCHLFLVSRADPRAPQNQNTCELDIKRIVNENSTRYKYEIRKDGEIYYVSEEFMKASFGVYIKMRKSTKNIPYLVMTFKFEDNRTHYDLSYLTLEDADMEKFCEIVRREDFKTEAITFNT